MKWSDLNGDVIGFIIACGLLLFLFFSAKARADTCLTIDLQPADVISNYDGDTYTIRMGPLGIWHIREAGIDTPERNKKQSGWREAKAFTDEWLHSGSFQLRTCFVLTLGRVVGTSSRNGVTLADALTQAGHTKRH